MSLYFFVALIPVLMFLDYFLTILSQKLYRQGYDKHITLESFELNPMWQKDVKQQKWFNKKHFIGTILATVVIGLCVFIDNNTFPSFYNFLFGSVLMTYCLVNARHISNILIFRYFHKHPDQISGQVHIKYPFSIYSSLSQKLVLLLPLGLIYYIQPTAFIAGCFFSPISIMIVHMLWMRKAKKT